MSSSALPRRLATAAASLPVLIWARDSVGSFVRVQGDSMEPELKKGDVVW
jgi:phage repressor protein C with HTH and peptisase S24 domain